LYALQMCLKVHLLFGPIHQCQIYFHASGSMKLIDLLLVINWALHIPTWNSEDWIPINHST
jgi:hypothetical protein